MSNSQDRTGEHDLGDLSNQVKKERPRGLLGIKREREPSEEKTGGLLEKLRKRQKMSHSRGSSQASAKQEKSSVVKAEPR